MNRTWLVVLAVSACTGCATAPPAAPAAPAVTWEQKLAAILWLEDQRVVRAPLSEPVAATTAPPAAAGRRAGLAPVRPAVPDDLVEFLADAEGRVRRRAALAIGRVGLPEGVEPLAALLGDPDGEVRQMATFALGLIGSRSAAGPLLGALDDPEPMVQGRAAQALAMIGEEAAAPRIGAMVRARLDSAPALAAVHPDDLAYPLSPDLESFRLGLYALARLKAWDPLASAVLESSGTPRARWWPVAYALQRVEDPRAAPGLLWLLRESGVEAAVFAARGLGLLKERRAVDPLLAVVDAARDQRLTAVAVHALGQIGDRRATPAIARLLDRADTDGNVQIEAAAALGALGGEGGIDPLLNRLVDPWPAMRGQALKSVAAIDPAAFLRVLSSLEPDPEWSVRADLARALALLEPDVARPRIRGMLRDDDHRVEAAALEALARVGAPDLDAVLRGELARPDMVVRATAARLLGERAATAAAADLAEAYARAKGDPGYVARAAALVALTRLAPEVAAPLLREALGDQDWAVRLRASQLLRDVDPSADVTTSRPVPTGRDRGAYARPELVSPSYSPQAYVDTTRGTFQVELDVVDAPLTTANFADLAERGFFDGVSIHRVVPGFVMQDGDPRGDGEGGPGYTVRDELGDRPYLRGTVGMALDWADTGGSQYFVTLAPQPHLDARYTVFGRVVAGMEVVESLRRGDLVERVRVWDGVTMREARRPQ